MPRSSLFRLGCSAVALIAIAACRETPNPTAIDAAPPLASVQASQGSDLPSAEELDRLVPGFGGFFIDRNGAPTVFLSRGSGRGPAEQALSKYLSARGLSVAAIHVQEARYGWKELQRYQDE